MHKTPLHFASVFSAFGLRVHACAGKSGSAMRPALLQSYRDANPRCSFSVPVCKPLAWKILLHVIPFVAFTTLEMQGDDVVVEDDRDDVAALAHAGDEHEDVMQAVPHS